MSLVVEILIYSLLMFDLWPQMSVKSNLLEINKCGKYTFPKIPRDCWDFILKYSMLIYRGRLWITQLFELDWNSLRIRLGHFFWTNEYVCWMFFFSSFSHCFSPSKVFVQVKQIHNNIHYSFFITDLWIMSPDITEHQLLSEISKTKNKANNIQQTINPLLVWKRYWHLKWMRFFLKKCSRFNISHPSPLKIQYK